MSRRLGVAGVAAALLAACGGGGGSEAPEILYGEDVCDHCRMVISERRHAAAMRIAGVEYRFDDPGCLLARLDQEPATTAGSAWVHDEAGSWLPVEGAWFVEDPERGTPMASGILAFGSAEAAGEAGRRFGGEAVRWREMRGRPPTAGE